MVTAAKPAQQPAAPIAPAARTYANPVHPHDAPDPAVIRTADGTFYAYTTQSEYGGKMRNFPVLRSKNLVDWEYVGDAMPRKARWAEYDMWAPHVVQQGNEYLMYYSANDRTTGDKKMGVARSSSPVGPFVDTGVHIVTADPWSKTANSSIDPFVFDAGRGVRYLFWGSDRAPLRAQRLSGDGLSLVGKPVDVLQPIRNGGPEDLIEGAWVVRHGGYFHLMYSGDRWKDRYAVRSARSRSPLGPYTRNPNNPILRANERFLIPGHHSMVTDDAGQQWALYHAATPGAPDRRLMLDRVTWRNGWPVIADGTPSVGPQPAPVIDARSGAKRVDGSAQKRSAA